MRVGVAVALLVLGDGSVRDDNNTEDQNRRAVNSQAKCELAEELIVAFGNAVPCPRTVMIKYFHTVLTTAAVLGSRRTIDVATFAIFVSIRTYCICTNR